ncbi:MULTISPECIES: GerMN domain-containing protein [unclassified Streptomyces]|uniref:GerMN domain-containing protein n=1 Tax=unclassified Streptomyces TaxID=2593676 RepID=UPI003326FC17
MTGSSIGRRDRRRTTVLALAGALAGAALVTGCGIRSTTVPVDAGPAPSQVPCTVPAESVTTQSLQGVPVEVYLVCSSQLVTVDRTVRADVSGPDRAAAARALLDELRREPDAEERRAGYATTVPDGLRIGPAHPGDGKDTLRLSEQPEDLRSEALAQIVCTYAQNDTLAPGGQVVLGGPGAYPARAYLCTSEMKARPNADPAPVAVRTTIPGNGASPGTG